MLLAEIERRKKVLTLLGEGCIVGQRNAAEYKLLCELEEYAKGLTSEVTSEVSEDMWEASKQYALRQVLASTDTKMSEQAYLDLRLFSGFELAVAHKDGAMWKKEQMMTEAMVGAICEDRCGYLYAHVPIPFSKSFSRLDKIKALIIKED